MMENENVRPYAARALGLIGDTRAIQPLGKALHTDESDDVRAAAAWALRQIGTQHALQTAAEHIDERSYLIQHEAKRAADALDTASG
jgi:PBS lyase HEAT-like repeat.